MGVKSKPRRVIAKPIVDSQLRGADQPTLLAFADECWRRDERELQYVACDVAPDAVRTFVDEHRDELSALSIREATRHLD